ncbi:MAG: hypothetical protein ISS70_00315 [Phycisphaerae bacterium]|nr:hypothetical protein [Phycisphaerae bacterium]
MAKRHNKRGPKPNKLQIVGNWEDALKKAVTKKKPTEGLPDKDKPKSK